MRVYSAAQGARRRTTSEQSDSPSTTKVLRKKAAPRKRARRSEIEEDDIDDQVKIGDALMTMAATLKARSAVDPLDKLYEQLERAEKHSFPTESIRAAITERLANTDFKSMK